MTSERFRFAWNNLMSSDPLAFDKGSDQRAAAIAARYSGLANNGGINSFLTCSNDLDASEVLESLVAVGALTAAKEFGSVLRGLGGTLPAASQKERFYALEALWRKSLNQHDVLSTQADEDINRALERHVVKHDAFYRRYRSLRDEGRKRLRGSIQNKDRAVQRRSECHPRGVWNKHPRGNAILSP